jgi:two-component system chemotaxis response regulator CheY
VCTRLLLVDDHEWFRRLVVATLEGNGYEVIGEAATAAEAVTAAHDLRPEVVLLDIALPDGNGFDVADRLAQTETPPVVVLISSRPRDDYGARLARPSVAGFISKDDLTPRALSALLVGRR